jgi:transcription initiation factor TFIIF subunit beta
MKEEGKRIRQDKDQVMDKLFEIFEKHQYYNIQDLVRLTSQPIVSSVSLFLFHKL